MERHGYKPIKTLGKGNFGSAILCTDRNGEQVVAKEVKMGKMGMKEREQCINEIVILRKLHHPNVVKYLDHFHTESSLYIIMELADSGDLNKHLKARNGRYLSEGEIMYYFVQVALALKYCHDKRVLHRDLKVENVLLSENKTIAKMADFGISKSLRSGAAMARTQCGDCHYSSPEIAAGRPYCNKSDIWSLGCLLYELCALQRPFQGPIPQIIQNIQKGWFQPLPNSFSREIRTLCGSMMQLNPDRRPSIEEVLHHPFVKAQMGRICKALEQAKPGPEPRGKERAVPRPEDFGGGMGMGWGGMGGGGMGNVQMPPMNFGMAGAAPPMNNMNMNGNANVAMGAPRQQMPQQMQGMVDRQVCPKPQPAAQPFRHVEPPPGLNREPRHKQQQHQDHQAPNKQREHNHNQRKDGGVDNKHHAHNNHQPAVREKHNHNHNHNHNQNHNHNNQQNDHGRKERGQGRDKQREGGGEGRRERRDEGGHREREERKEKGAGHGPGHGQGHRIRGERTDVQEMVALLMKELEGGHQGQGQRA